MAAATALPSDAPESATIDPIHSAAYDAILLKGRDISCRRWLIKGRVQGVGFRWFVRATASDLGLAGAVCNLPDGGVEVIARGSEDVLDRLEEYLNQGPPGAHVVQVQTGPGDWPPESSGFHIRQRA
ncbi:MAG: acylphosphatase [Acidobacteriota bacterium]